MRVRPPAQPHAGVLASQPSRLSITTGQRGHVSAAATAQTMEPITKKDLVAYIADGCKPRSTWRIGTEHEKLGFYRDSKKRIDHTTIALLLEGLCKRHRWNPIMEGEYIIGAELDGQSVTIEPGGQFELSGAPVNSLHDTSAELTSHIKQVKELAEELGVSFLSIGFDPKWKYQDVPIMPKNRYRIMRDYMPRVGSLGHDMMFRSTTIQVNIDYEDERDMVEKMRVGLALQPLATALFSNSPFRDGQDTGYLSWRSHVWEDVDPDRCGILPFVWDEGFGFERYTEFALDVPMYFAYRDDTYLDATQQRTTFRQFLEGKLPILPDERPTLKDWEVHLTTIFPEVRLKRYMEMRGGDGGPCHMIVALSAFWIGLLYSRKSQDAAYSLVKDWSLEEHRFLRKEVPKAGLQTAFRQGSLQDVAKETTTLDRASRMMASQDLQTSNAVVLKLSRKGLEERGLGEAPFLDPLDDIAASGKSQAVLLREKFAGEWQGSIDPVYKEHIF